MVLKIFTDGSYSKNQPDVYGWAAIFYENNECSLKLNGFGREFIESWQIGGECEAVLQALRHIATYKKFDKFDTIEIHYDYLGVEKWATREWSAKKDVSKKYIEQFDFLKNNLLERNIKIKFFKVKGHSGIEGNEIADEYARKAVLDYYQKIN